MSNIYGDWLKAQREAAGLTQQELADQAFMTRSHISHIEAGRRIPSKDDARRLDKALNTGDVLTSFLPDEGAAVAEYFEAARLLEQQATAIHEFAPSFVPGILQTEKYARAVLSTSFPPVGEEECDRLVGARLDRAKILDNPVSPIVWALLDEAVLRRVVGSREIMADQIMHMIRLVESGRVRVHVMPYAVGAYQLLQSLLALMWFEDQPPVAYSEGVQVGKVHDSPAVVTRLQGVYALALTDALSLKESLGMMRAIAEDYGHRD